MSGNEKKIVKWIKYLREVRDNYEIKLVKSEDFFEDICFYTSSMGSIKKYLNDLIEELECKLQNIPMSYNWKRDKYNQGPKVIKLQNMFKKDKDIKINYYSNNEWGTIVINIVNKEFENTLIFTGNSLVSKEKYQKILQDIDKEREYNLEREKIKKVINERN